MVKKQTAVERFAQRLQGKFGNAIIKVMQDDIDICIELEKQQIEKTWFDSTMQFDNAAEMTYKKSFEQYYTETYESTQRDRSGEA